MNYYSAFGLKIRSEFELPELRKSSQIDEKATPVDIVAGAVPEGLLNEQAVAPGLTCSGRSALLKIGDIGRMLVTDGRTIVVQVFNDVRQSDMRAYLLGLGFGTIIHQRCMLPLHVSAVLSPYGAIAFTGVSGAGKSTTAATINQKYSWPLVSDDLAVVRVRPGRATLEGGVMRCRLWSDALKRLGHSTEGLLPDLYRTDKYQMEAVSLFVTGAQPLLGIVEIVPDAEANHSVALQSSERLQAAAKTIYRPMLVGAFRESREFASDLFRFSATVPFFQVSRQTALDPEALIQKTMLHDQCM